MWLVTSPLSSQPFIHRFTCQFVVTLYLSSSRLVLETLEPLSGDRKCFRMINGVLTERTVKDVVPILKSNADNLKDALDNFVKQYKAKQDEMEKWKVSPASWCTVTISIR